MVVLEELNSQSFANTLLIVSIMGGVDLKTLEKEVRLFNAILKVQR